MSAIQVMTDELWDEFVAGQRKLSDYLFLEPHKQLQRQWKVEGEDAMFNAKLDGVISRHGAVSVWGYERFAEACVEAGYTPVFMEDPSSEFAWRESLNGDPGVSVESKLDGRIDRNGNALKLVRGFLPFQAQGINFMRSCERATYFQWSTGTGKTLAAEGTILTKRQSGYGPNKDQGFDVCLYVVKPNNLYNSWRKLREHTGIESRILTGTPKRRERLFAETAYKMQEGEQPILIMNAEKFREDTEFLSLLVEDKKVLVIFDEMPTKYANRSTALYRATCEVLYKSFVISQGSKSKGKKIFFPKAGQDRPSEVFYVGMSATPIRNSPEDLFNCVRLMDSRIFGTIDNFNNMFAGPRDRWNNVISWRNLDLMGAMVSHIFHQADKENDPEIAAQFPAKLPPETIFCDMDKGSEKLYAKLQNEYDFDAIRQGFSILDWDEILAAIGCFQMICSNPRSVLISAKEYEAYMQARTSFEIQLDREGITGKDKRAALKEFDKKNKNGSEVAHKLRRVVNDDSKFTDQDSKGECVVSKMLTLRDLIESHDDKVIVFTAMNETLLPLISEWLTKWNITHVCYHGMLSPKQKQDAQDAFRNDPAVKVFLSTDAGQDSIDLPEASLTIHYDEPWTWATKKQRENRQDRIDSAKSVVRTITLAVPNTVEDRKAEIISRKHGYHKSVFEGEIAEQAEELRKSDFLYILTGE